MLLALDVGNTETVIGVFGASAEGVDRAERTPGEINDLLHSWRIATVPSRTCDELALLLINLLRLSAIAIRQSARAGVVDVREGETHIDAIAVASSVPAVTAALRAMVEVWFDVPLFVVEPGIRMGMAVRYDDPKEVGADRIANTVGALDLFDPPAIVVDLGTATTFDAISEKGDYLGGVIVPGLGISMDALFAQAARLRRVELVAPPKVIGRSTVESMQAGAIYATAAMVDGVCARVVAELGEAVIIATGGFAGLIAPHTSCVRHVEPWLTLHGLRVLFERNAGASPHG